MQPEDILSAESVCSQMSKNLEIHFKLNGENWNRGEAEKQFKDRTALARVRLMLIDEAERLLSI